MEEGEAEEPRRHCPGFNTDFRHGAPAAARGRERMRGGYRAAAVVPPEPPWRAMRGLSEPSDSKNFLWAFMVSVLHFRAILEREGKITLFLIRICYIKINMHGIITTIYCISRQFP